MMRVVQALRVVRSRLPRRRGRTTVRLKVPVRVVNADGDVRDGGDRYYENGDDPSPPTTLREVTHIREIGE